MTKPARAIATTNELGARPKDRLIPPVEKVRPGLWSVPVPLPNSSLRYVFVYVLETDRGPYLVDAGWNTDEAYTALAKGLLGSGTRMEDVQGVLVTHVHPDHYGLAGRVGEASGAWIALHPADAALIPQYEERDPAPRLLSIMQRAGAPQEVMERQRAAFRAMQPYQGLHRPDRLVEDGSVAPCRGAPLPRLRQPTADALDSRLIGSWFTMLAARHSEDFSKPSAGLDLCWSDIPWRWDVKRLRRGSRGVTRRWIRRSGCGS